MKDCSVCFCCRLNSIGLHHTVSKGRLNASVSKSMATEGTGIGNDERTCIPHGVDLAGPAASGEQIPLSDPEMQSLIAWYCPMKKWSKDCCRLLKGGCGNIFYTLKTADVASLLLAVVIFSPAIDL